MRNLSLIFILLFTGKLMLAQQPEKKISWKEDGLSWELFLGQADPEGQFHASTNTGLSYSYSLRSTGGAVDFIYRVESFFYPDLSWVNPDKKNAERLLVHEQLHFDITELHARKLRKALNGFDPRSSPDVKRDLEQLYRKTERSRRKMQKAYDRETVHGVNEAEQLKWEERIRQQLLELESYSS